MSKGHWQAVIAAVSVMQPSITYAQTAPRDAAKNLAAQLSMAHSAQLMFYVGIAEITITFVGVMLVLATLLYTKRAAEAARDAVVEAQKATGVTRAVGEAQVRAYLHVKSITANFIGGFRNPYFTATVVNSGQSPARSVVAGGQVRYEGPNIPFLSQPPSNWRDALGKAVPSSGEETISVEVQEMAFSAEAESNMEKDDFDGAIMSVRIVFAYRDVFDKTWEDDAYFVGLVLRNTVESSGLFQGKWKANLGPIVASQDWGEEAET